MYELYAWLNVICCMIVVMVLTAAHFWHVARLNKRWSYHWHHLKEELDITNPGWRSKTMFHSAKLNNLETKLTLPEMMD